MPAKSRASFVGSIVLSVLILLVWSVLLVTLADMDGSDAMGKALAKGFATLEIITLWVLLGILLTIAIVAQALPMVAAIAAGILLVLSGIAAISAVELLANQSQPPYFWPILTPASVPPLIVVLCFWGVLPALHARVPMAIAAGTILGAVFVLTAVMLPMNQMHDRAIQRQSVRRDDEADAYGRLAADAPLWEIAPFLKTRDGTMEQAIIDRVTHLDRRQADAEIMLDRDDFPLAFLRAFDLDPTPALCGKARGMLRRRAQSLVPKTANSKPYAVIADEVAGAVAAIEWLVGYGCSCDAESLAWESMANAYRGSNFDLVRLRELRDPAVLGRTLREDPPHFSMLTPQSHLKAWLKFAGDKALRERALAGARQLDHRTADAIELLRDEPRSYALLMCLPVLDLETTPEFCEASLTALHSEFVPIHRPLPDDPRSYQELLDRLGIGRPLVALQWVASHGCDADRELGEAEALVRSYQDSPERAAMLARLAELHRHQ
jgi:ABC-type transport system involved in multi-copper enzyme maturation permease subunit